MNQDMTKGRILPNIIRFTIPLLLGNIFQQFYNMADTMIVGRCVGSEALAAVGATGSIMFLVIGFASGLGSGFAVVTSQRFGAGDGVGMKKSVSNGILLMLGIGIGLTILFLVFMKPLLRLMNTPEDIFDMAYAYISVICGGLLVNVFYNLFAAFLRAIGNSRIPLYFLILASVLNIVMDFGFIMGLHMGVAGAALATVASQAVSAILCGIYIWTKEPEIRPEKRDWIPDGHIIYQQLYIGIPMSLQFAITASGCMVMQTATNLFGSAAVAGHTAANKVQNIFTQPMVSIGQTMATYCGQNYGSGDIPRVRKGVRQTIVMFTIYSVIAAIGVVLLLPYGMQLFFSGTENLADIMPWAKIYIYISVLFYIPLSYIYIFRNAMQGCGRGFLPMAAGILEMVIRLVFAVIAMAIMSYPMSVMCDAGAWLGAGIFTGVSYLYIMKDIEKKRAAALSETAA